MSRDYRHIKNGKFRGRSFNVNAAGTMLLGAAMASVGLPHDSGPVADCGLRAPHDITGEKAKAIRAALRRPGFKEDLHKGVDAIPQRERLIVGTTEEVLAWVMEFLEMANNPEGFASDYCSEYE